MKEYSNNINEAWKSIGKFNSPQSKSEKFNKKFRRSIFFSKDIKKGDKITSDFLTIKRPKIGICPSKIKNLIGKKASKNFKKNNPVKKNSLI